MTPKQRLFCLEYLIDYNGTQAAIRAGYSERSAASIADENLRKPEIAAFIAEHHRDRLQKLDITADRIKAEIAKIGFADIRKAVTWRTVPLPVDKPEVQERLEAQPHGGALKRAERQTASAELTLIDSAEIDDDTAGAISEISQGPQGLRIKMHNKLEALDSLARIQGMFKDEGVPSQPVVFIIEGLHGPGSNPTVRQAGR